MIHADSVASERFSHKKQSSRRALHSRIVAASRNLVLMKTREGSVPDLVRAMRAERPRTEEIEATGHPADDQDDGDSPDPTDARPRPIRNSMQTAEIDMAR